MADPSGSMTPKLQAFRLFLPFFVWLIVIFALSSYPKAIIPQSRYFSWDKLAHIIEFGILGYLTARAAYFSGWRWLTSQYVPMTIIFGILFAAGDEWHQLHVPGRYASVFDVIADGLGILLGLLLFTRNIHRTRESNT